MMSLDAAAIDEAVRRQIQERLGDSMFVEAGAGTGKTRALVDRYVALVLAGHTVERLVALTRRHALVPTGGSDYHGFPMSGMATASNEPGSVPIPPELVEELLARRKGTKDEGRTTKG